MPNPSGKAKKGETKAQAAERRKKFYTQQRKNDEAKAAKGDRKAAGEASKIYSKLGRKNKARDYGSQARGPVTQMLNDVNRKLDAVMKIALPLAMALGTRGGLGAGGARPMPPGLDLPPQLPGGGRPAIPGMGKPALPGGGGPALPGGGMSRPALPQMANAARPVGQINPITRPIPMGAQRPPIENPPALARTPVRRPQISKAKSASPAKSAPKKTSAGRGKTKATKKG